MNVTLTATELLHILETLLNHPLPDPQDQSKLLIKIKNPILDTLEREDERVSKEKFGVWAESESKRIEELSQKNIAIAGSARPKVASMKSKKSWK
jgi:hypothetical protein